MSGGAIITNSSVMSVGPRRIGALPLDYGQPRGSEGFQTRGVGSSRLERACLARMKLRSEPRRPRQCSVSSTGVQPLFPARCLRAVGGRTNFRRMRLWRVRVDGRRTQGKKEDSQSAKHSFTRRPRKSEQSFTPSDRNKREQNCNFRSSHCTA